MGETERIRVAHVNSDKPLGWSAAMKSRLGDYLLRDELQGSKLGELSHPVTAAFPLLVGTSTDTVTATANGQRNAWPPRQRLLGPDLPAGVGCIPPGTALPLATHGDSRRR